MSLLATHGDTFPPQLYPVLESVLGLPKAKAVLQSVARRIKNQYDPNNVMYNNCKPRHRKKVWTTTQVLMEVQFTESMAKAMQVKEGMQQHMDTWINGREDSAISMGSSTEAEGLNTAVTEVFALLMDLIKKHPAAISIMTVFKDVMMRSKSVDKHAYPFSEVLARVHQVMQTIMLTLQALDEALNTEQAQVIKWEVRTAIMKGKQGDKKKWAEQCLDCE
jgi:hypothetical protein